MAEENKVSELSNALNDLRTTSTQARVNMHANVAAARPVDAWAAMGEAYPGAVSPTAASLASVPATAQTIPTEAVPTEQAKKSLAYVTEAHVKAEPNGLNKALYQADEALAKGGWDGKTLDNTEIMKSIQARPTYMKTVRDPFSDDFYKSEMGPETEEDEDKPEGEEAC